MEVSKCSKCLEKYYRTLVKVTPGYVRVYVNELGKKMNGNMCQPCWTSRNHTYNPATAKSSEGVDYTVYKSAPKRPCPFCRSMTVNRYACTSCWEYNTSVSNRDLPKFTQAERNRVSNEARGNKE